MRDLLDTAKEAPAKKDLRPHQVRAIEMLRASLGKGNRRVVIQGPTGFGKTLVAAKIIEGARGKGNRVIFTAPAINLIDQTVTALEAEGLDGIGVMQSNHPRTDPRAPLQVASVQTLARRDIPAASLVIVDECHLRAEVIDKMMEERPDLFFVGLSATPWAKGMGLRWQDLVIPCTIGELIEAGYLSEFRAFAPDVPDLNGVKVVAGEYAERALEDVMGEAKLVGSVVETWLDKGGAKPTLVFGVNRAHAGRLHQEFTRAGVSSEYVDGFTDRVEREYIGRRFRNGDVQVICSVRTMTTGVDLPVSCIVDAAPTRSEILHVQKIGRGLRVNPGTEDLVILDHAGNSLRLGLVTDILHADLDRTPPGAKQEARQTAKLPKECEGCGTLHTGLKCPACGAERRPPSGMVETADGELVEMTGKGKPVTMAEKQVWYSGLIWIAESRGYKPGWAAQKYRTKFGVWPDHSLGKAPQEPTQAVANWVKSEQIRWAKARERAA